MPLGNSSFPDPQVLAKRCRALRASFPLNIIQSNRSEAAAFYREVGMIVGEAAKIPRVAEFLKSSYEKLVNISTKTPEIKDMYLRLAAAQATCFTAELRQASRALESESGEAADPISRASVSLSHVADDVVAAVSSGFQSIVSELQPLLLFVHICLGYVTPLDELVERICHDVSTDNKGSTAEKRELKEACETYRAAQDAIQEYSFALGDEAPMSMMLVACHLFFHPEPSHSLFKEQADVNMKPSDTVGSRDLLIKGVGRIYPRLMRAIEMLGRVLADLREGNTLEGTFQKLYENENSEIWGKIGNMERRIYTSDDFLCRRPLRIALILRLVCQCQRKTWNPRDIRRYLGEKVTPGESAMKGYALKIRKHCESVFGKNAAVWNNVVRTSKGQLVIEIANKPYSELLEHCPKCKRHYKPNEEHLVCCPACSGHIPRQKSTFKGKKQISGASIGEVADKPHRSDRKRGLSRGQRDSHTSQD